MLDAHTLGEALRCFALASADAVAAIFTESYVSLAAVLAMYVLCLCLAKSGGWGTIPYAPPPQPPGQRQSVWEFLALRCAFLSVY